MTYKLIFLTAALREWNKLSSNIQIQFKKKLQERLQSPRIPSAKLGGMADCYKIKLKSSGYRLVYQVYDERVVVQVIAVGKRDKSIAYNKAKDRLL